MTLEFLGGGNQPDPVDKLREQFDQFRDAHVGYADHILSEKSVRPRAIAPDGAATATLNLVLKDLLGERLATGGATVAVQHRGASDRVTTIGPVVDRGAGTYSVELNAGITPGRDEFKVTVDDGNGEIVLYPHPVLEVHNVALAAELGDAGLSLNLHGGAALANRPYLLLGSASGTDPGFDLLGQHVPLNADLLSVTLYQQGQPGVGSLDREGNAHVQVGTQPVDLSRLRGREVCFSWVTLDPIDFVSHPLRVCLPE
jgi:hypothetical protein